MEQKIHKNKYKIKPDIVRIFILFTICAILYYLPAIIELAGGVGAAKTINQLHDFYGLDFYAVIFFVPVVYAAYSSGVIKAVVTALLSMAVFTPYWLFLNIQPSGLFRPTAFVLTLSAVGAVVAMLQRGDEQKRNSLNELKCLYDIGKAAETSFAVEKFINSVMRIIPQTFNRTDLELRITFRNKIYINPENSTADYKYKEDLLVAGEVAGSIELNHIFSGWGGKSNPFFKTLAERIGGAIHSIELEQSLNVYYEELEVMVENRTRELEQAQQKLIRSERLAAVGELASGVGHELRNPLNVIRNCVYLINMRLEGLDAPEAKDTLKLLDSQVDVSNKIVTDLLDFTRVKPPAKSEVDLNSLVKARIPLSTRPENISINFQFVEDTLLTLIDPEQVGRAFTNIIDNAIQAMHQGGKLTICTGEKDQKGWISFSDTGCGITPENLKKIFEPLFTTKPRGIGLGLAITKRMVEQNGGEITVESEPGKGTTFTAIFPLQIKEVNQYETAGKYSGC